MKIKIFEKFNSELENFWTKLESDSNSSVFQSYNWNKLWYDTIGFKQKLKLKIVLVFFENKVVMLFPFILKSSYGFNIISFIGDQQSDYLSPLINYKANLDLKNIWSSVISSLPNHDLIFFNKLTLFKNKANLDFLSLLKINEFNIAHSSSLSESLEDYNQRLRSKLKSDLNRQKRRLSNLGKLKFKIINDGTEFKKLVPKMISQKRDRYKKTNVPDPFINELVKDFYINLIDIKSTELIPHYSVLMLDDEIIAAHLGIIYRKRFYYLLPSYSSKYMVYSPGKIQLYFLIEHSILNNLNVFDFTIGGESYKKEWCDDSMKIYYYFRSNNLKGIFYKYFLKLVFVLRKNQFTWSLVRKSYIFINKLKK